MTTTKKTNHIAINIFAIITAICLALLVPMYLKPSVYAENMASKNVSITNGDFNSSTSTSLQSTPNGWSKKDSSTGKSGVINVNASNFSNRASSYALTNTQNPEKAYTSQTETLDDYVLMINSKSSTTTNEINNLGYQSNSINLEAYSFYKFSVWTLTQSNSFASIYLSGIKDSDTDSSFEKYSTNVWIEYRFYVATGAKSESVSIELWLGTKTLESYNAVFFDHITVKQLSENYFDSESSSLSGTRVKTIDLREFQPSFISNSGFESGSKDGWSVDGHLPTTANSKVVSVNNSASFESLGIENLGSNLSSNNDYAFVIYSTNDSSSYVGYKSTSFKVLPNESYKITVWAKLSSNFNGAGSIVLQEGNDIVDFYSSAKEDFYTPVSKTIEVSANTKNELTNDYTPYYFYVKGHSLYETSFTIGLYLGTSEKTASGAIAFDDIRFEVISGSDIDSASTTNSATLECSMFEGTESITNGTFTKADKLDADFVYPVKASDWTTSYEDKNKIETGIINTYTKFYEANKDLYGNARNPQNPTSTAISVDNDVNNIYMMYNKTNTYQTLTSPSITTTLNSYQKITFDYKTVQQDENTKLMNVYILDSDDNVIYADEGLYATDWTTYSLLLRSTRYTSTLKIKIALGTEDNKVSGYSYLDNFKFTTDSAMTDDLYKDYVESHKTLDFSISNFNFISNETKYNYYTPYRYTQKLESGSNVDGKEPVAYGGIIDGENNAFGVENSKNNKETLKYMPALRVDRVAKYSLVAKEQISLESGKYYKVSVDILTKFIDRYVPAKDEKEEDYPKYGAIFSLDGLDNEFTKIVSNDEWTTYSLFVKASDAKSVYFRFAIFTENENILGQAFFDNLQFEESTEKDYNNAIYNSKNDKTILAFSTSDTTTDDDKTDDNTDKKDDNTLATTIWYLIPTLILALSLILALVAYGMKKVKIKKWEKKRQNDYDREKTLHRDVVRQEASQIVDSRIKDVEKEIEDIKSEITRIEEIHKANSTTLRTTAKDKISREVERDFKAYASKHTKLENSIEALNAKIENMKTPEYALSVQRKIIIEKINTEKKAKEAEFAKIKQQKREVKLAKKNAKNK